MAITDLTGTTWLFNSTVNPPYSSIFTISFNSNNTSYTEISADDGKLGLEILYDDSWVYENSTWSDEAYRTIAITGGTDATDSTLIAWLEANAENVTPAAPDLVVTYAGNEIATLSDSGTKTLKTQGKYCTDDITINYTKSGGGGGGGDAPLYIFTQVGYTNANAQVGGNYLNGELAFYSDALVEGATVTFYTWGDYILEAVTGKTSGNTIPYTTVTRGTYTFTMPNESVHCSLLYDD